MPIRTFLALLAVALVSRSALASTPPCQPCAGLRVQDPASWTELLAAGPELSDEARLYLAWNLELDGSAELGAIARVEATGATPWLRLVFRAEAPLEAGSEALDRELAEAVALARTVELRPHFQILWLGGDPVADLADYAYLFKRASAALAGANRAARVITAPLPADPSYLSDFYARETSAYLDGVALLPPAEGTLAPVRKLLDELDPGRPLVIDALDLPRDPAESLSDAARLASRGAALIFFAGSEPDPSAVAPFRLLANEFQGDLSLDPYSTPEGAQEAWSFVRGEDLGLRVVVLAEPARELVLQFDDPLLSRPSRYRPDGSLQDLYGLRRTATGLEITITDPRAVEVLRIDRRIPAEIEGLDTQQERLEITDERTMPVEEILRRLQAFEDSQLRKLDHFRAVNTMHLRFAAGGAGAVETTFRGDFFFRQGEGFDWVWEELLINGVRWRDKRIPDIPLLQPEKAAALPLEIHFGKRYRYRLRGTDVVDGRDCWQVEFVPNEGADAEEGNLYRGTVWIDREIYARVRTRAVQLGLEGEVLSNEETVVWQPLDASGQPAPWQSSGYWVPTRIVGQQLVSLLGATVVLEKEMLLTEVAINSEDFDARKQEKLDSELTMVRDTDDGLRYLVKGEEGERVVQEEFDNDRLFLLGGVFWDDALDYPLPLVGINYLSFDFRGTGNQMNVFFGGAILTVDYTDPAVGESRFNLGADAFALAVPLSDTVYRDGEEVPEEEVRVMPANFEVQVGHPIGNFLKVDASYQITWQNYRRGEDKDPDFVVPVDHFIHSLNLGGRFSRGGYRLSFGGSYNRRSDWEDWGYGQGPEVIAETEDFLLWDASLAKNWYLPKFQRLGTEINYVDGQDLDRFSKYEFGFFGDTRVHGFQSGKIKAEQAWLAHLSYGVGIGEMFRLDFLVDGALANDEETGLDDELLAGVGLAGTFVGPWRTVVNLDVGVPIKGPDEGFVAFIAFLKLFG